MRTTIEIPDSLFRQAKRAALDRGTTLKELVTQAMVHELENKTQAGTRKRGAIPAVRLRTDAPILHMTPEELAQADADEELQRAHANRR